MKWGFSDIYGFGSWGQLNLGASVIRLAENLSEQRKEHGILIGNSVYTRDFRDLCFRGLMRGFGNVILCTYITSMRERF